MAQQRGLLLGLGLAVVAFVPYYRLGSGSAPEQDWAGFGLKTHWYEYAGTEFGVILHYLRLCFWPLDQCLDYGWPIARRASEIVPAAIVIVPLLVGTGWGLWRNSPWGFLGAWLFLILAPTSSVMPIVDPAYEHRMYLPSMAIAVAVVAIVAVAVRRRWVPSFGPRDGSWPCSSWRSCWVR